jgi:hypothetical protein
MGEDDLSITGARFKPAGRGQTTAKTAAVLYCAVIETRSNTRAEESDGALHLCRDLQAARVAEANLETAR